MLPLIEICCKREASEGGTTASHAEHFRETLGKLPGVTKVEAVAGQPRGEGQSETSGFRVYASGEVSTLLASAAQAVIQAQGELLDPRFAQPSLEDVFIYLTGRKLRS